MTQEQFAKYKFQHSEVIIYHHRHPVVDIEMMLVGIDFDNNMLKLTPFDTMYYEDNAQWFPIDRCDKPKRKPEMKILK